MNPRINYFELSTPLAKKMIELGQMIQNGSLPQAIHDIVNIRASQINGCAFCLDMHVKEAKLHGERELRVYHIPIWRESSLFSEKEKAALEWTEALTVLSKDGVSDEIFNRVSQHFSATELSELSFAIGMINSWNRLNVAFHQPPGSFDDMLGLTKAGLK